MPFRRSRRSDTAAIRLGLPAAPYLPGCRKTRILARRQLGRVSCRTNCRLMITALHESGHRQRFLLVIGSQRLRYNEVAVPRGGKAKDFDPPSATILPNESGISSVFTMSPIFVANPLSPMPAASYILPHDKSKTRKLHFPAARVGELVRQTSISRRSRREVPTHARPPKS